jgi:hypothetical protein
MLYNMIASFATFATLKISLGAKRVVIRSLIALVAGILLANLGSYFLALLFALALAHGLEIGFYESIIAKATKNRVTVSFDTGLLIIPQRLAEFASVLFAGFVAQSLGYMPVFTASGFFFTVFSVFSLYILKTRKS